MRQIQWMALPIAVLVLAFLARTAAAQPGHAPFTFAPLEIEDYERTLAPAGIAGATIVNPSLVPGVSHPKVIANGNVATSFQTGAPIFLDRVQSAFEQYGGILGHTGATLTTNTYNDLFPGGTSVAPGGYPNGGATRNFPNTASYNGTVLSLVTKSDANTADDVGVTSGNQALRVSMLNVGQGDGNTSFDRPAMLVIKANDFWGVSDSRFNTFETVRANPSQYNVSIDVTMLASEMPDTFATDSVAPNPYVRLGFISGHGGIFDESPPDLLQGPPSLSRGSTDTDGDGLPDFSDNDYVDPNNTVGLPGKNVPGVFQRRYVFPATAMDFPTTPLAGVTDLGNDGDAGGWNDAYMIGFVFNGNWALNQSASFIIDNMKFVDRNPVKDGDFNNDGKIDRADWMILVSHLNGPGPYTFAQGDIGSVDPSSELTVSPGLVDFQDVIRFKQLWDAHNGAGSFSSIIGGVPEPSSIALMVLGLVALATWNKRLAPRVVGLLATVIVAASSGVASAQLTNTSLFSFETPPDPNPQQWAVAGDATSAVGVNAPTVNFTSSVGATDGTRAMTITQSTSGFSWDAGVGIFGGSNLPDQTAALAAALDNGADLYALEFDVTYKQSEIPFGASFVNMSMRLNTGALTDQVDGLAVGGDGAGNVPNATIHVSVPLSSGPLSTSDGVLSVPTTSAAAGFYNITLGLNHDASASNTPPAITAHVDNIHLVQKYVAPLLTLEINTTTGAATIKKVANALEQPSPVGDRATINYYEIRSAAAPNAADGNADGTVNAADYTVWRDHLGQTVPAGTLGDYDKNGTVQTADYNLWKANFGQGTGTSSLNPAGWNTLDAQNIDAVDDRGGVDAGSVAGDSALEGWDKSGTPSSSVLSEAFLLGSSTRTDGQQYSLGNIYTPGAPHNITFLYQETGRIGALRQGLVTYVGPGAGSAVPEPGTLTLSVLTLAAGAVYRRRQFSTMLRAGL